MKIGGVYVSAMKVSLALLENYQWYMGEEKTKILEDILLEYTLAVESGEVRGDKNFKASKIGVKKFKSEQRIYTPEEREAARLMGVAIDRGGNILDETEVERKKREYRKMLAESGD